MSGLLVFLGSGCRKSILCVRVIRGRGQYTAREPRPPALLLGLALHEHSGRSRTLTRCAGGRARETQLVPGGSWTSRFSSSCVGPRICSWVHCPSTATSGCGLSSHQLLTHLLCGRILLKIRLVSFESKLLKSVLSRDINERHNSLALGHKIYAWVNKVYTHTRDSSMEKFYRHMTLS